MVEQKLPGADSLERLSLNHSWFISLYFISLFYVCKMYKIYKLNILRYMFVLTDSLSASCHFCRLLFTFVNSLDLDPDDALEHVYILHNSHRNFDSLLN